MKVAFQGTKGAYSEVAINEYFNEDVESIGFELSEQVCEALEANEVAMGVLPVENSIVGNVNINMDLLLQHNFFAIGEYFLKIKHHLLALPGTKLEQIEKVHSHPIALSQCRDFLNRHNMRSVPDFDTAGACMLLRERGHTTEATIASSLCEEYYGLEIIEDNIQKVETNFTRFLVFVKEDKIPESLNQEKTSIALKTKHHPGALLNCLQVFKNFNINLTKLESRPIPENPFDYIFFIDFTGALTDPYIQMALKKLKDDAAHVKILGSYPAGKITI